MMDYPWTNQGPQAITIIIGAKILRAQPIKSKYFTLSTNHMRALRVL